MAKIETTWACPICHNGNKIQLLKPHRFSPTLVTADCEECESTVRLQFYRIGASENRSLKLQYEYVDAKVSDEGQKLIQKSLEEKLKPANAEINKGDENANRSESNR